MVEYGYVYKFLWELTLIIYGNYFVMGLIYITTKNLLVSENSQNDLLSIFNNNFSTDTGIPEKNITPLNKFNDGYKVSICQSLNF